MATIITDECINCGACLTECPTNAISEGDDKFEIDGERCVECIGFHEAIACAEVCPVDACVITEDGAESKEQLVVKLKMLFPDRVFGDDLLTHFRK